MAMRPSRICLAQMPIDHIVSRFQTYGFQMLDILKETKSRLTATILLKLQRSKFQGACRKAHVELLVANGTSIAIYGIANPRFRRDFRWRFVMFVISKAILEADCLSLRFNNSLYLPIRDGRMYNSDHHNNYWRNSLP